jgi:hypothetical protein
MSTTTQTGAGENGQDKTQGKAPKKVKAARVLDLTATAESGPRTHEQIVNGAKRQFTFKPGEPLELPIEIAVKFLKHAEAFKLVNAEGEIVPYNRQPKQPEDLQAGETLALAENETIARFDELSTAALVQRVMELPGGEQFAQSETKPERSALVAFLIDAVKQKRKGNQAPKPDVGPDEFVPDAEIEDAA